MKTKLSSFVIEGVDAWNGEHDALKKIRRSYKYRFNERYGHKLNRAVEIPATWRKLRAATRKHKLAMSWWVTFGHEPNVKYKFKRVKGRVDLSTLTSNRKWPIKVIFFKSAKQIEAELTKILRPGKGQKVKFDFAHIAELNALCNKRKVEITVVIG